MKKLTESWKQQKQISSKSRNANKKFQQSVLEQGCAVPKKQDKRAASHVELGNSSYNTKAKPGQSSIKRNKPYCYIPSETNDKENAKSALEQDKTTIQDSLPSSKDPFWESPRLEDECIESNKGSEHHSRNCAEDLGRCSNILHKSLAGDILAEIEKAETEYLSNKKKLSVNTEEPTSAKYTQLKSKCSQELSLSDGKSTLKEGIKPIKGTLSSSSDSYSTAHGNKLSLSSWNLPDSVVEQYRKYGVTEMFQWQVDCLLMGRVLEGGNLVFSAPTSAGKTLVAEILILKKVLECRRKALMVLPFISVAKEKMLHLQRLFSEAGARVDGYMDCHSPAGGFKTVDVAVCTIEKANGLVNRLLEEGKLHQIGIVVIDELHMLGDSHRGYLLELLLTKVIYMCKRFPEKMEIQIVGMSATLPNLDTLAHWLQADLYTTDFRPVPLHELIKIGPMIYDSETLSELRCLENLPVSFQNDADHTIYLSIETVINGHSTLIFCPSKAWCEKLAESTAREVYRLGREAMEGTQCIAAKEMGNRLREELKANDLAEVLELLKRCPAGLDSTLGCTIRFGVGFHHAGLTFDEREIIENAFRCGVIRILIATSTLSSGVNLPARRVIIRSPSFRGSVIDILTYKQMVGRAGRKGVDTEGESILLCKENEQARAISLVKSALTPVQSCLIDRSDGNLTNSVKRAILEVIASAIASTAEEVLLYASSTLLASSQEEYEINSILEKALLYLQENEFIHLQQCDNGKEQYKPTKFGKAVLASSMSPDESLRILEELRQARKYFVLDNDLHLLYQVIPPYLSDSIEIQDWILFLNLWEQLPEEKKRVGELVGIEERFMTKAVRGQINSAAPKQLRSLVIHQRFYTTLALNDLINEIPLSEVALKYNCPRGTLQSLQRSTSTFAGMITVFCNHLGWYNLELLISHFHKRLYFGVQHDLCDLMRLSSLNAQRARALHNGGYETVSLVASADVNQIEVLLKNSLPFESLKKAKDETDYDVKRRCQERTVWITGQKGVTEKEAAEIIIKEARDIIQFDLGIHINWDQNNSLSITSADISSNKSSVTANGTQTSLPVPKVKEKNESPQTKITVHNKNAFIPGDSSCIESRKNSSSPKSSFISTTDHISFRMQTSSAVGEHFQHFSALPHKKDKRCANSVKNQTLGKVSSSNYTHRSSIKASNVGSAPAIYSSMFNCNQMNVPISHSENSGILEDKNHSVVQKDLFDSGKCSGEEIITSEKQQKLNESNYRNTINCKITSHEEVDNKHDSVLQNTPEALYSEELFKDCYLNASYSKQTRQETQTDVRNKSFFSNKDNIDIKWYSNNSSFELTGDSDKKSHSGDHEASSDSSNSIFNMDSGDALKSDGTPVVSGNKAGEKSDGSGETVLQITNHAVPSQQISPTLLNCAGLLSPWIESSALPSKMYEEGLTSTPYMNMNSPPKQHKRPISDMTPMKIQKKSKSSNSSSNQHSSFSDCISPTPPETSTNMKQGSVSAHCLDASNHTCQMTNTSISRISKIAGNSMDLSCSKSLSSARKTAGKATVFNAGRSFSIIDVTHSSSSFKRFLLEWQGKSRFSFSVACERQQQCSPPDRRIGLRIPRENRVTTLNKGLQFGLRDIIVGLSVCWNNSSVFYVSFSDTKTYGFSKLSRVQEILEKSNIQRIGIVFDIKEQYNALYNGCGILLDSSGITSWQDPKVADWLLDQNSNEKSFYRMVSDFLPMDKVMLDAVGKCPGVGSLGLASLCKGTGKERSAVEAFLANCLMDKLWKKLTDYSLDKAFTEIEMPTLLVLAKAEQNGFGLNISQTEELQRMLQENLRHFTQEAYRLAGRSFSLNSPEEIAKILFKELKLISNLNPESRERICRKTSSFPSTAKQSLLKLKHVHPLPGIVLEWRKLHSALYKVLYPFTKKKTFNAFLQMMRIYGRYDIFTSTGRISMYEPNLQTVPRHFKLEHRSEENGGDGVKENSLTINMRCAFIPFQGAKLLAADYSQLEIRILAHLSKDKKLTELLNSGGDIFKTIASQWKGGRPEDVSDLDRQHAKQICYGMIYGVGIRTLSDQLDVEEEEASIFMERFKATYPGVRRYLDFVVKNCRREGYIETLHGRRRYLPSINSPAYSIRAKAERQAVNATIQGSAADIVKMAMIKINQELENIYPNTIYPLKRKIGESSRNRTSKRKGNTTNNSPTGAYLVLELHDELIYEVLEEDLLTVANIVKNKMENAIFLSVDLPVKIKVGSSWGNMTDWVKIS